MNPLPLQEALTAGTFVVTTEMEPPKGPDLTGFRETARLLKGRVHAVNVTDNQRAVMRLTPLVASHVLQDEGLDPIYQLTCRDRNRLALQSDLLGASALGIRNLLVLMGDPPTAGDHKDAKPVFDIDSLALLRLTAELNQGRDLAGNALEGKCDLFPGAALNPAAEPMDPQVDGFERKLKAGARFFQTQAVFEVAQLERFLAAARARGIEAPVLAGIIPLKSAKMARFMNEKVPGIKVPESMIERLEKASDPKALGVEIAADLVRGLRGKASGVHLMTIGEEAKVLDILDRVF